MLGLPSPKLDPLIRFEFADILGALAWVIGAYFHVAYLRTQREHLYWIYVTTAFWAGDRVLRLLSLLINNTPLRLLSILNVFAKHFPSASPALHNLEPSSSSAEAEASIVGDGEFVRLRIRPARKWPTSRGRPGTYVFISIPGDKRVWESHPFSIAWPLDVPLAYTSSSPSSSLASSSSSSVRLEDEDVDVAPPEMIELVVKRCEGFTKRLARAAGQGDAEGVGGGARSVKILVEGPYGTVHTFEKEKWVLLVAGGSGIAATVVSSAMPASSRTPASEPPLLTLVTLLCSHI